MSSVPIYQIGCPNGHTIDLPGTILEGITHHLRGSYAGEPVLNFVCSECKTASRFDWQNTEPVGWTDAPRQIAEFHILSVQSGCDGSSCGDHVVLVAVRNRDRSEESVLEEKREWDVSRITCTRGFHALPMGTPKRSDIQFFAGGL
jgi:hypothetical protein